MIILKYFSFTLLSLIVSADSCENVLKVDACTFSDENSTLVSVTDQSSCLLRSDLCCWDGKTCFNKVTQQSNATNVTETDVFEFPNLNQSGIDNSRRRFGGLPCLSPLPPLPIFPVSCKISRNEPYVVDPPIDIPYCMRIACSEDKTEQKELEQDHKKCGTQPGCYFDVELHQLRNFYGDAVLPGVPVCQLVIRKPVFFEKAKLVVDKYGFWNPYFTNCLLNTFKLNLHTEDVGCQLISAIKAFKIEPKMKGWSTINSYGCRLIDGCWNPSLGCFAPVNPNEVTVKSGQESHFTLFEVRHGKPQCQAFDTGNSFEIIRSYHRCQSAGCSVDMTVSHFYNYHLFNIGNQMSIQDHQDYWKDVKDGNVASIHDLENMKWPRDPTKQTNSSIISECGSTCKNENLRPCPPHAPPSFEVGQICPYRPPITPQNLSPLKGTFEGCCKINLCHHPKNDYYRPHSGPSAYYTGWGPFSPCSASCGEGTYTRFRKCVSHDKDLCTEALEQTMSCTVAPCGKWSRWSSWSKCRGKSWSATVKRTRKCVPQGAICNGPSRQKKRCNAKPRGK